MKTHLVRAALALVVLLAGLVSAVSAQDVSPQIAAPQTAAPQSSPSQAATAAKPASDGSGWEVVIYPVLAYVPLAGIDITLPSAPPCTGCEPSVPVASGDTGLSGAYFGALRVEKGRIAFYADVNYAGLRAERTRPLFNVKVNVVAGSISGGVKIVEGLYAEAGARYYELDMTATVLTFPEVGWKPNKWQPMIGATFRPRFARRWWLFSHVDYAGFGGGDASTVNGYARLEWRPIRFLALTAGYGFSTLRANGEIRQKPIDLKYTLHGPIIGFGIPF